ncbi:MAG: DUF494 family protein [bacterium]
MNERVVEILLYIMSEIRRSSDESKQLELLSKDLIKKGYTECEISSAFSWLLTRLQNESEEIVQNQGPTLHNSFRLLHEIEHSIISTEAYGYIIQLKELGIINELDVEQILERAMMLGSTKVHIEDIKSIVAAMIFSPEGYGMGPYILFEDNSEIH